MEEITYSQGERLRKIIHYENQLRRVSNIITPRQRNIFKGLTGEKIINKDGTIAAKYKELLIIENIQAEPYDNGNAKTSIFYQKYGGLLYIVIRICFSGGTYEDKNYYCHYVEKLGLVHNLEGVAPIGEYEPEEMLNFEKETRLYLEAKEQAEQLEKTKDKMFYKIRQLI